jgi:hypothetical protein
LVFEIYIPSENRKVQIRGHLPKSKRKHIVSGKDKKDIILLSEAVYDYIVISKRHAGPTDKHSGTELNILLIEWKDKKKNVASRIGNAWMEERDWMCLDREWKLVILK